MATKKTAAQETPAIENTEAVNSSEMLQAMQELKKELSSLKGELAAQKKENEELKKNSVRSSSPYGGESDAQRVAKACKESAEAGTDPWGIKISVLAPRIGKGEDSYWLCVNGRSVQVPANDRYFELALPFAECLVNEISARHFAADYIDQIEVFDPKTNPHPVEKIV